MIQTRKVSTLKISILSISLLSVMAGAVVSPGVAKIVEAFPDSPQTLVKMAVTFPMIFIFIFSLINARLTDFFKKRTLVFVGLALYLLGGVGAGFANSVGALLVFRALLGMGIGFLAPLAQALISDYFSGSERAQMMGFATAVPNFACIVITYASGVLAAMNWRYMFALYGLAFITLVVNFLFLREPQEYKIERDNTISPWQLPGRVYLIAAGAFMFMIFFYSVVLNISIFLRNQGIGGADMAGIIMAELSLAAFLMSTFYSHLYKIFKDGLIPISVLSFALSFLLLYQADTFMDVFIATIFVGFGYGIMYPTIALKASHAVPNHLAVKSLSVSNSLLYLGQFLSPLIFGLIGFLAGDTSIRTLYLVLLGIALLVLLVIFIAYISSRVKPHTSY